MDLTMALLPVVSFVIVVFITIIFLASRYKRCPSDKILVVYGKVGQGPVGASASMAAARSSGRCSRTTRT